MTRSKATPPRMMKEMKGVARQGRSCEGEGGMIWVGWEGREEREDSGRKYKRKGSDVGGERQRTADYQSRSAGQETARDKRLDRAAAEFSLLS